MNEANRHKWMDAYNSAEFSASSGTDTPRQLFALLYESQNCGPAYGPKLAGVVESEAEAQQWAARFVSLFVRRFYEPVELLKIERD